MKPFFRTGTLYAHCNELRAAALGDLKQSSILPSPFVHIILRPMSLVIIKLQLIVLQSSADIVLECSNPLHRLLYQWNHFNFYNNTLLTTFASSYRKNTIVTTCSCVLTHTRLLKGKWKKKYKTPVKQWAKFIPGQFH